jgi:hypothetical protein
MMPSQIKLIIDENSALCDISGDKMEITAMLVRLFLRQPHLLGLFEAAIGTVKTMESEAEYPEKEKPAEKSEKKS